MSSIEPCCEGGFKGQNASEPGKETGSAEALPVVLAKGGGYCFADLMSPSAPKPIV